MGNHVALCFTKPYGMNAFIPYSLCRYDQFFESPKKPAKKRADKRLSFKAPSPLNPLNRRFKKWISKQIPWPLVVRPSM